MRAEPTKDEHHNTTHHAQDEEHIVHKARPQQHLYRLPRHEWWINVIFNQDTIMVLGGVKRERVTEQEGKDMLRQ